MDSGSGWSGDAFEALIGAIHSDRGYAFTEKFIFRFVIEPYVDIERREGKITSYKSLFIEWCQKHTKPFKYVVYDDTGNDELKHFAVRLQLENVTVGKARATSKKKAEERASKRAYHKLQVAIDKDLN